MSYIIVLFALVSFTVLPIDITLNIGTEPDSDENHRASTIIGYFWKAYYWINFIGLWFIIPFFQYYVEVEPISFKYRLLHALKQYLIQNLIVMAIGLVALVLIIIFTGLVTWSNLESFVLSCGNLYGTLFIIFGLGYGLVKFPKQFLDNRNIKTTMTFDYYTIGTSKLEKKLMKNKIEQKYFEMYLYIKLINDESIIDDDNNLDEIEASLERTKNTAKSVLSESKCENIEAYKQPGFFSKTIFGKKEKPKYDKPKKFKSKVNLKDITLHEIFKLENTMKDFVSKFKHLKGYIWSRTVKVLY